MSINNPKVSIIMPVYNAVEYIDAAIKSILAQTYPFFELIIIDDGATDGTAEVCLKYAAKDERILYIRQSNGGICKARNEGIKRATGKYIAFSDHDDEYMPDYLELMVKKAELDNLDIVKCGVYYEEMYSDKSREIRKEFFKDEVLTKNLLIERYVSFPVSFWGVWNSLYKASMLRSSRLSFPENIRHGQEDFYFNTSIIPFINRIGFLSKCLYKHFRRLSQSTSAKFYNDRIDAMQAFYQMECKVLKPLVDDKKWQKMATLIYSQKITGILSYCFRTLNAEESMPKCKWALDRFMKNNPYLQSKSMYSCIVQTGNLKYAFVLYLATNRYYKLLFLLWNLKNR